MARSSLKVDPGCIGQVEDALLKSAFPSKTCLAEELGLCRTTISRFFAGKGVEPSNFIEISHNLGLDWQDIAYNYNDFSQFANQMAEEVTVEDQSNNLSINTLMQKLRQHCQNKLVDDCGAIKLLDVSESLDLSNLSVDVDIREPMSIVILVKITCANNIGKENGHSN